MNCYTVYSAAKSTVHHAIRHTGHFIGHHAYVAVVASVVCVATPAVLAGIPSGANSGTPSYTPPQIVQPYFEPVPSLEPLFQPSIGEFYFPPNYDVNHSAIDTGSVSSPYDVITGTSSNVSVPPVGGGTNVSRSPVPEPGNSAELLIMALMLLGCAGIYKYMKKSAKKES